MERDSNIITVLLLLFQINIHSFSLIAYIVKKVGCVSLPRGYLSPGESCGEVIHSAPSIYVVYCNVMVYK